MNALSIFTALHLNCPATFSWNFKVLLKIMQWEEIDIFLLACLLFFVVVLNLALETSIWLPENGTHVLSIISILKKGTQPLLYTFHMPSGMLHKHHSYTGICRLYTQSRIIHMPTHTNTCTEISWQFLWIVFLHNRSMVSKSDEIRKCWTGSIFHSLQNKDIGRHKLLEILVQCMNVLA